MRNAWLVRMNTAFPAAMSATYPISPATPADAPAIAQLYAHHVLHGTATFEIVPPDAEEIENRLRKLQDAGWPWLAARDGAGTVLGYAYAGQLGPRAAYRFSCENSIYVRHDLLGRGIGTALLAALIKASEDAGFRQMIALIADNGIAGTQPASVALHERAGFTHCGLLKGVGRKHGRWLDLIYMQRRLGAGDSAPPTQEP